MAARFGSISRNPKPDWLAIVESAYVMDGSHEDWLNGILVEASRSLDQGLGVLGFLYDATASQGLAIGTRASMAASGQRVDVFFEGLLELGRQAAFLDRSFRLLPCATLAETLPVDEARGSPVLAAMGVGDVLGINGMDPSGLGCGIGAFLPARVQLTDLERTTLSFIATHLSMAFRLRRRLRAQPSQTAVAVIAADRRVKVTALSPSGQPFDTGALVGAADRFWQAQARRAEGEASEPVAMRPGLVRRRWTLFGSRRRRHASVQVHENPPPSSSATALAMLTDRERQVADFFALGHAPKVIAYELGISHSTVRVLLQRIRSRLNATDRHHLRQLLTSTQRRRGPA